MKVKIEFECEEDDLYEVINDLAQNTYNDGLDTCVLYLGPLGRTILVSVKVEG